MATRSDRGSPVFGPTLPSASWPPANRTRPALSNRPSLDPIVALAESLGQTQMLGEQILPEELIRSHANYPELNSPHPELNDTMMKFLYGDQRLPEPPNPVSVLSYVDRLTRDKPLNLPTPGPPLIILKGNVKPTLAHVRKLVL